MFRQNAVIADSAVARGLLDIKRAALLFDRIVVLRTSLAEFDDPTKLSTRAGLFGDEGEWLGEQGILSYSALDYDAELAAANDAYAEHLELARAQYCSSILLDGAEYETCVRRCANEMARAAAIKGNVLSDTEHVPLVYGEHYELSTLTVSPGDIPMRSVGRAHNPAMVVVFHALPTPDELTPWEAILDYRRDPETRQAFAGLRNWVNEATRAHASPRELYDTLEWELQRYERALRLHRIKFSHQVLEAIVTTPFECVENLIKMRWNDAAKCLFAISRLYLERLEGEETMRGRELHYLVRTRERFGARSS